MNYPLDQELATPREEFGGTVIDPAGTSATANSTGVGDATMASAVLAGSAPAEVDEAIRAIHGW